MTTFPVATSRTWNTSDGERHNETEWFNVVSWGNLAEICKQYLHKDQPVYVEGRLQTRGWEDQEGKKHFTSADEPTDEPVGLADPSTYGSPAAGSGPIPANAIGSARMFNSARVG